MDQLADRLPVDGSLMECELELFRAIVDSSHVSVAITDDEDRIRYWNHAAETLFGHKAQEALGVELQGLIFRPEDLDKLAQIYSAADGEVYEIRCVLSDNRIVWVELNVRTLSAGGRDWRIFVVRDVHARKTREFELEKAALTDPLSGLINRREFQTILESADTGPVCLAFIDIDSFKTINDKHGHLCGDEAIVFLARELESAFEDAAAIFRLGGDEFGVLLSFENGQTMIEARFSEFCEHMSNAQFSERCPGISVSIGVSFATGQRTARELLTVADECLYEAKQAGRSCARFGIVG